MNETRIRDYKSLIVWQKAIELVVLVYNLTEYFPSEEKFALTSQIQRAAVSIPANIAEGKLRGTDVEFRRFALIAFASGGELETHIEIAKKLKKTQHLDYVKVDAMLNEVMKMLNVLISKLGASA